jgi:23S rRNA (pseudouridine1915-N3)-methyltransferase
MQQIKILSFKTNQSTAVNQLEQDFMVRLQRLAKVRIQEINSTRYSKLPLAELLKKEAQLVQTALEPQDSLILLTELGQQFSSEGFAKWLEVRASKGQSRLAFVIGSPNGFDPEFVKTASFNLSLSKMTFTAQFARMLLLEQLYRGFAINNNLPYHKAGI